MSAITTHRHFARCLSTADRGFEMREKMGARREGGKQSTLPPDKPPAEILPPELEEQIEALRSHYFEEQAAMQEEVES